MEIKALYRYPVKSLSPQSMETAKLAVGLGIPGDRAYALALAGGAAVKPDHTCKWLAKGAFHVLAKQPQLADIACRLDGEGSVLELTFPDGSNVHCNVLGGERSDDIGAAVARFLGLPNGQAPTLVKAEKVGFFDTLDGEVSILNLGSLREVEKAAGVEISPLRFRPNIIIDGAEPWSELQWAGSTALVGSAELAFTKPTGRCPATHVNPDTATRDLKMLSILKENFGHTKLGVYAHIKQSGEVQAGDTLKLFDQSR